MSRVLESQERWIPDDKNTWGVIVSEAIGKKGIGSWENFDNDEKGGGYTSVTSTPCWMTEERGSHMIGRWTR
jgi:hypothetical protein